MQNDLREFQLVEKDILFNFVEVCEKHNLKYYLAYGTLLGARRHKGFIPWDDDVDVCMPRADYDRFCNEYYKCLSSQFQFRSFLNDENYYSCVPRIESNRMQMVDEKGNSFNAWIDIFPLDVAPRPNSISCLFYRISLSFHRMLLNISRQKQGVDFEVGNAGLKKKLAIKLSRFFCFGKLINTRKALFRLDKRMKKFASSRSGWVVNYLGERFKDHCKEEIYGDGTTLQFEERKMNCPTMTDDLLAKLYGSFMEYPPEKERNVHGCSKIVINGSYGETND